MTQIITPASYDEWSRLRRVIVGTVKGAHVPLENESMLRATVPSGQVSFFLENFGKPFSSDLIEAADFELETFCKLLENFQVKVLRPKPGDIFSKAISTPDWKVPSGFYAAMPRDCLLMAGVELIAAPMAWRSRQNEAFAFQEIIHQLSSNGVKYSCAPKPKLKDSFYTENWSDTGAGFRPVITEEEPTFDAADFIRFGSDIIGQQSHVTNLAGIEWLKKTLNGQFNVHILRFNDDHPMHIDATLMPLRPGLALINPERVPPELVKELKRGLFKDWELIPVPESALPKDQLLYMTSRWINMNVLSIDESHVVIEEKDDPMAELLESLDITPVRCPFRNFNALGGSFHCATLDFQRDGTRRKYLSL